MINKKIWGDIGALLRGGLWLYASSIINNVAGFIYWIVISKVGSPSVLGITTAVVGLASLISTALSLGITMGSRRFLGKCMGAKDYGCLRRYFYTSLTYSLIIYLLAGITLMYVGHLGFSVNGISPQMLKIVGAMVALNSANVFSSLLTSTLKTGVILASSIAGNSIKIILGIYLVVHGLGWVGAALGYVSASAANAAVMALYGVRIVGLTPTFSLDALKDVIKAGVASWLPGFVIILGNWLGVLAVFISSTAVETGHYYIAFAISNIVLMISGSMMTLLLPVLSGLSSGRRSAAARVLKLSVSVMVPVAVALAVYPYLPLSILGKSYIEASRLLIILLLGVLPVAITACVSSLTYAIGLYDKVLLLGLSQNIPRFILYYVLTPRFSGLGAALAFTAGSFTGFTCALIVARWLRFDIGLRGIALMSVVPLIIGTITWFTRTPWFIGLPVIACSYLAYIRFGVLSRADVRDVAYAFLSEGLARKVYVRLRVLLDYLLPPA